MPDPINVRALADLGAALRRSGPAPDPDPGMAEGLLMLRAELASTAKARREAARELTFAHRSGKGRSMGGTGGLALEERGRCPCGAILAHKAADCRKCGRVSDGTTYGIGLNGG